MYNYLPMPEEPAKELNMVGANLQLIYGLKDLKENVLRFWVLCALEADCMAPSGANLACGGQGRYKSYMNCHRFDQSAVNILVAWANDFKGDRYWHYPNTGFQIVRF